VAARFAAIGMLESVITNMLKNKNKTANLVEILDLVSINECSKAKGLLLYALANKLKPNQMKHKEMMARQIVEDKWTRSDQLDEGIKFVSEMMASQGKDTAVDMAAIDAATGVGIVITEE